MGGIRRYGWLFALVVVVALVPGDGPAVSGPAGSSAGASGSPVAGTAG